MSGLEVQVQQLVALGRRIHGQRADLQAAFPDPDAISFWWWLQTHGWLEHPEVREASVPVPPAEIRQRVNCGDSWAFLLNGASIHKLLLRALAENGTDLPDVGSILDFGCGPGRVLRFLLRHAVGLDVVGIDVDPASVEWCGHNLPFGTFYVNAEEPPTELPDSRFGFAYAISVFSHLSEANQHAWLRELARVMRDGGLLVVTVHGRRALNRAAKEESVLRMLEISPADLASAQSDVERRGIAFISQPEGHLNRELYGISFVTEEYVRRSWTSGFDCVGYESGALDDWQDAVVLRRTAGVA